jgi:phage-related holin
MRTIDALAFVAKITGLIFAALMPIRPILLAVLCLVFADMITGMWASKKEKKKITSSRMRRTVIKLLAYQFAIIFAFILETWMLDGLPVVNVITGLIGLTEGKSFFENIRRISGVDFWSEILSKLNMPDVKNDSNEK